MNGLEPFQAMEQLRDEGWCVVIKCIPKELGWIVEGSRSEYDAPCEDKRIGHGKWCCEAQWVGKGDYKLAQWAMCETPQEAIEKVRQQIHQ